MIEFSYPSLHSDNWKFRANELSQPISIVTRYIVIWSLRGFRAMTDVAQCRYISVIGDRNNNLTENVRANDAAKKI